MVKGKDGAFSLSSRGCYCDLKEKKERRQRESEGCWKTLRYRNLPRRWSAMLHPIRGFVHSIFLFFSLSFFSSISNCYYYFHFPAETVLPTDANHLVTPFINPNLFSFRLILLTTYLPMLNNPLVIYFFRFCTFAALFCYILICTCRLLSIKFCR